MLYGYVRVSTKEQSVDRQIAGIKQFYPNIKDENIYIEYDSGLNNQRKEYGKLIKKLKAGDELVIHEIDRLGRDKEYLKKQLFYFNEKKVILRILELPTTLHAFTEETLWVGDMINNIILEVYISLAEREREKLSIRTKEGLEMAKQRGAKIGRPKKSKKDVDLAIKLYQQGYTIDEICHMVNMSRATLYKYIEDYLYNLFDEGKSDSDLSTNYGFKIKYIKSARIRWENSKKYKE